MKRAMNVRRPWLWLYLGTNIIGAWLMYDSGYLIGDVGGKPVPSTAILALALGAVLLSYGLILGPLFNFMMRLKVTPIKLAADDAVLGGTIGKLLLFLQLLYFVFNSVYGVNTAGSAGGESNIPFALFWVLVPVDALMVVYYAYYRDHRLFYPNLLVWVVSNVARGWSGVFFFIIFFEWCRAARRGKIPFFKVGALGLLIVVIYPLLINLKWIMRASAQTGLTMDMVFDGLEAAFANQEYFTMIGDGLSQIVGRFQTTSTVVEVIRLRDFLSDEFNAGRFTPFWREGLHGILYDRLFSGTKSTPIGVAFTGYAAFEQGLDIGSWNTNIGFAGWMFIAPAWVPLYLVYTLLLGFVSCYLVKKLGMTAQAGDMVWLSWLVYLLPPWHAAFVAFLYALFVFIVIKVTLVRIAAIAARPRPMPL